MCQGRCFSIDAVFSAMESAMRDDDEEKDEVVDVKVEETESGVKEANVTRASGKTGRGTGAFTTKRAIDNAVTDSE
jgi:hypothetical protein